MGGEDWSQKVIDKYGHSPSPAQDKVQAIYLPSLALETLIDTDQGLTSDADEFGRLPTGDSLIDVGGTPGPMAIGTLMKWGLEDKDHKQWIESQAKSLISDLDHAATQSKKAIDYLKSGQHGSKYYNIKQFRNATVRQLARSRRYQAAHDIWMEQYPFRYQDWMCPNREGIVLGIAGRLLALAKNPAALETLTKAMAASKTFYQQCLDAEAGKINGLRPQLLVLGRNLIKDPTLAKSSASTNGGQRGGQGAPPASTMTCR